MYPVSMSSPDQDSPNTLATVLIHLHAANCFQVAAFAMLIYDYLLTFSDEVERIWKQRITGASILFLINRYVTPIQYIILIDAFQDPMWPKEVCNRFVVFEGATSIPLVGSCELIMILRVYALYGRSTLVLVPLLGLLALQVSVIAAGLHTGFAVPLPAGVAGCILSGTNSLFAALWVAPLVTDTCIFILTLWKTHQHIKRSGRSPTIDIYLRDGAMYFCVVFGTNLLNTFLYSFAPEDLKAVGASFNQLMTSVMISRLVLNLRSLSSSESTSISVRQMRLGQDVYLRQRHNDNSLLTAMIGNLGEDFDSEHTHTKDYCNA